MPRRELVLYAFRNRPMALHGHVMVKRLGVRAF
jgi:hypothetical protein